MGAGGKAIKPSRTHTAATAKMEATYQKAPYPALDNCMPVIQRLQHDTRAVPLLHRNHSNCSLQHPKNCHRAGDLTDIAQCNSPHVCLIWIRCCLSIQQLPRPAPTTKSSETVLAQARTLAVPGLLHTITAPS